MDLLIDWAEVSGIVNKLNLKVRTDNTHAIALYRSKGFVVEGTIFRDFYVDGNTTTII